MLKKIILLFGGLIVISSCKKYEDDPFSSRFLTVKARITLHSWEHASVYNYKSGHIYSTSIPNYHTYFSLRGDCSSEANYLYTCYAWKLINHKNEIRITYRDGQQIDFKITTLTWKNFDIENDSMRISLTK